MGTTNFDKIDVDSINVNGVDLPLVQANHIANIANNANGTAIATAVNAILTALENYGVVKKS